MSAMRDKEDLITDTGKATLQRYADEWKRGSRDLAAERANPEDADLFFAVRTDPVFRDTWATAS